MKVNYYRVKSEGVRPVIDFVI